MESDAMWSVFLIQDLLAVDGKIRKENTHTERINIPADPNHYWNYRMHLTLEELMKADELNSQIKTMIKEAGR
jgi:4-alpha-glucanotransferase